MNENALTRTPSSILRKRANKENDGGKEGKRAKMPSRRVSFAPDEELSTMHLYQKMRDDGEEQQVTEDLSSRMPYSSAASSQPQPLQDSTHANTNGSANHAAAAAAASQAAALTPHHNQLIQLEGTTGDLFSPLSMDLTNNSFEFQRHHQHQQPQGSPTMLPPQPPPPPQPPLGSVPQPPQPPLSGEYTRNITSAIPALSTLVEEDEEGCHEGGSVVRGGSDARDHDDDMDLSMYSTDGAPARAAFEQHQHQQQQAQQPQHAGPQANDQVNGQGQDGQGPPGSPSSPFACDHMRFRLEEEGLDGSGCLKSKWGFTPGADDTLDMSHGRQVMGENTYNHVYGNGTTGDITKAFRVNQGGPNQGPLSAVALRAQQANHAGAARLSAAHKLSHSPRAPHSPLPAKGWPDEEQTGSDEDEAHGLRGPANEQQHEHATHDNKNNGKATHAPHEAAPAAAPCLSPTVSLQLRQLEQQQQQQRWQPVPAPQGGAGADEQHASLNGDDRAASAGAAQTTAAAPPPPPMPASRRRSSIGFGGGRASIGQPEVTINLLAEDSNPVESWKPQLGSFMGQPSGAASALPPTRPSAPPHPITSFAAPPTRAHDTTSNTTALLGGGATPAAHPLHALAQPPHPAQAHGPPTQGLLGSGPLHPLAPTAAQPNPTATGFTMQLLADNGSNHSGHMVPPPPPTHVHAPVQPPAPNSAAKPPLPPSALKAAPPSARKVISSAQRAPAQLFGSSAAAPEYGGGKDNLGGSGATWTLPGSAAGVAGLHERSQHHEHLTSGSFVAAAAALPPPPDTEEDQGAAMSSLPSISFQDFLGIVEVRFLDDMRRRTSLMQPFDGMLLSVAAETKPQNLVEGVELLHVRGVRACLQQQAINDLSERVEALQGRLTGSEALLARENPPVFQFVQTAKPAELDCLRDQVKLLKRACRHRTMIHWKQERIKQEQALSSGFRTSFTALESEAKYMAGVLEEATGIEAQMNTMHLAVLQFKEQDQNNTKAAQLTRERLAYQQQRLAEVAAQNEARQRRLEGIQEQRRLTQERYDAALQEKAALQASLLGLQGGQQQSTPTKSARKGHGSSAATTKQLQQLAGRQEALDVVVGLQGIHLDVCSLRASNTWSMTVLNRFCVRVDMSGSVEGEPRTCDLSVETLAGAFQGSEIARRLLPGIGALLSRTTSRILVSKLRQTMDALLHQFGSIAHSVAQLEAAQLRLPGFGHVELLPGDGDGDGADETLGIWFLSTDGLSSAAKLGVTLPLSCLQGSLAHTAPPLGARVVLPAQGAEERAAHALQTLAHTTPSLTYLQQLCDAAHQHVAAGLPTAHEASQREGQDSDVTGGQGDVGGCPSTPHPMRMQDNPLFT